jgi:hypothetical protein
MMVSKNSASICPIFSGGVATYLTPFLRQFFGSQREVCVPPEMNLIAQIHQAYGSFKVATPFLAEYGLLAQDVPSLFRQLLTMTFERARLGSDASWLLESSPENSRYFADLHDFFPDACFLHIVCDGRDVAASLLNVDLREPSTGRPLNRTEKLHTGVQYWLQGVEEGRVLPNLQRNPSPKFLEIRYEDLLVGEPALWKALEKILGFKLVRQNSPEIPHPQPETFLPTQVLWNPGKYREVLSIEEIKWLESELGSSLKSLGYCSE